MPTFELCLAFGLFLAKHFLADFVLQTRWMALGKERADDWLRPLAAHATIHAAGTLAICLALAPRLAWFAPFDFIVHASLDRFKGVLARRWRLGPSEQRFWLLLGFDQSLHGLTHFVFCLALAAA